MKVGLFICDHVSSKYQTQFGDYSDMFDKLFPTFEWVLYDVCNNQFPENLEECDLYMATGSKHSVYEDLEWITQLKNVIVQIYEQQKYFIGVCFGHQLIGEALGGRVGKSPKGWCVGIHEFEVIANENWMKPLKSKINLLMMCQDQILKLPENAKMLAKSDQCANAIITVGNKILGIQAHPEFNKAYNKLLMEQRVSLMGKMKVNEGIQSLDKEPDADVIQSWILQFVSEMGKNFSKRLSNPPYYF